MKIKYSKFEINMWDIFFLILFLGHLLGGIYILFNEKEKAGIFFLVIGISYFIYRFLLVMIIKNKMKFDFSDYEVKIKGLFFEKTIAYNDIKTLTVRKNILGSYDIFLNFDSSMNIYKYFCNLIIDVSIESNHKKSYIFCDIKNKDEILDYLLEKIGYLKKEIREKVNGEKLYVKYSIFEKHFMMCFAVFNLMTIFSVGIAWGYLNLMIKFQNLPFRITPKFTLYFAIFAGRSRKFNALPETALGAQIPLCTTRANFTLRQVEFNAQIPRRNFTTF